MLLITSTHLFLSVSLIECENNRRLLSLPVRNGVLRYLNYYLDTEFRLYTR